MRGKILSTEGNRYYPGRYHIVGETGIFYTSIERDVTVQELGRHAARANLQGGMTVGKIKVKLQKVFDLTQASARAGSGANLVIFENNLAEGCLIEVEEINVVEA